MSSIASSRDRSHISLLTSENDRELTADDLIAVAEAEVRHGRHTTARLAYERALTRLGEDGDRAPGGRDSS